MLTQQLSQNLNGMSGLLVVRAEAGELAELIELASELAERPSMQTMGDIVRLPSVSPPPPPPPEE